MARFAGRGEAQPENDVQHVDSLGKVLRWPLSCSCGSGTSHLIASGDVIHEDSRSPRLITGAPVDLLSCHASRCKR
jgi:hypothetical protein